jgi:hypothetical protein
MEFWNIGSEAGMVECWKNGVLGLKVLSVAPSFHYSSIPLFQLLSQHSITPSFQSFLYWNRKADPCSFPLFTPEVEGPSQHPGTLF